GIVTNGSLGEGSALLLEEKIELWQTCVAAIGERVPVWASVAAMTTAAQCAKAAEAQSAGCSGLMVLPPYVYRGDWREMKYHVAEVVSATSLSSMLYNTPLHYGPDFV